VDIALELSWIQLLALVGDALKVQAKLVAFGIKS
jgi:hypothetical protein